jgi:hypothetical protein
MDAQPPNDRDRLIDFIAHTVEVMRDQMATKSDLAGMATKADLAGMATKGDLAGMATKSDLARLEAKLEAKLDAGLTAIRGDIERLELRLDSIERAIATRLAAVEAEVSRLRSVVYLLVKDQPELLRLLGTEPRIS